MFAKTSTGLRGIQPILFFWVRLLDLEGVTEVSYLVPLILFRFPRLPLGEQFSPRLTFSTILTARDVVQHGVPHHSSSEIQGKPTGVFWLPTVLYVQEEARLLVSILILTVSAWGNVAETLSVLSSRRHEN